MINVEGGEKKKSFLEPLLALPRWLLLLGGSIIGFVIYQIQIKHFLTWNTGALYIGIVIFFGFILGAKENKQAGTLSAKECFKLLFSPKGYLKNLQKEKGMPGGEIIPTGIWAPEELDSEIHDITFGYKLVGYFGEDQDWGVSIKPSNGDVIDNREYPSGFTGKNKKRFRTHPKHWEVYTKAIGRDLYNRQR